MGISVHLGAVQINSTFQAIEILELYIWNMWYASSQEMSFDVSWEHAFSLHATTDIL